MRRAAQLEIDAVGGDAAGSRLKLVDGPSQHSVAAIGALADSTQQGTEELLVSLRPPIKRSVTAPKRSAAPVLDVPVISLVPPKSLAITAQQEYAASRAPGSAAAEVDSPLDPGTPKRRYVTAALSKDSYPPAGRAFYDKFEDEYGRAPDRWAIYGYEAVGLIVDALGRMKKSGVPVTQHGLAQTALRIRDRFSPVGHYDVLPSGQSTLYIFQARGSGAPTGPASLIETLR